MKECEEVTIEGGVSGKLFGERKQDKRLTKGTGKREREPEAARYKWAGREEL